MPKDIDQGVVEDDLGDGDLDGEADLEDLSEDDLDDGELEDEGDGDLDDEDDLDDDDDDDADDDLGDDDLAAGGSAAPTKTRERPSGDAEDSAADEEDDEELDDDDVEASLDVILKERLVVEDEEQEDEEEPADAEDRGDGSTRVLPKQPGEFVCQSCFLVKNETQLADRKRMFCRDCV